jgi:hypothetical protein
MFIFITVSMQFLNFRARYYSKSQSQLDDQSRYQHTDSSKEDSDNFYTNSDDESNETYSHLHEVAEEDSDSEDEGSQVITPVDALRAIEKNSFNKLSDKEKEKARRAMADELIRAALDEPDKEEDGMVPEEKQRSLRVGIIGAVNAGKSTLTNFMVCSP